MSRVEPDRRLFLAVPLDAFDSTFRKPITEPPIEDLRVSLFVFDPLREAILRWIP